MQKKKQCTNAYAKCKSMQHSSALDSDNEDINMEQTMQKIHVKRQIEALSKHMSEMKEKYDIKTTMIKTFRV